MRKDDSSEKNNHKKGNHNHHKYEMHGEEQHLHHKMESKREKSKPYPTPAHHDHHAHMVSDFRKRFWISLIITFPILALSPMIQKFLGLKETIRFAGDSYLLFVLY